MGLLNKRVQPIVFDDSQFNQLLGLGGSAVNMPLLNKRSQPVLLEATQFAQLLAAMGGGLLSVETGITASITQTQAGAYPLTKNLNEISICANDSDAIRLPSAITGIVVYICNHGVEICVPWPSSGDEIENLGVDNADTTGVVPNTVKAFFAIDDTHWVR